MPTLGWLMIGVANRLPPVPWLVTVKVDPWISSGVSLPDRARAGQIVDLARQPQQAEVVGVVDHRHHQAIGHRGGHTDMVAALEQQPILTVDSVDLRHSLQRRHHRLDEIGGEGQADALGSELGALGSAMCNHRGQVGLHHRGDVRRGTDAGHHVLGDQPAQPRVGNQLVLRTNCCRCSRSRFYFPGCQRHELPEQSGVEVVGRLEEVAGAGTFPGRQVCFGKLSRLAGTRLHIGQHILLGDATVATAAGHLAQVDVVLARRCG